ncbi:MAG TPA: POTRA domain-containing protein [Puia sp.]|nr:POTRA domain-containing protein [Puia sp.]
MLRRLPFCVTLLVCCLSLVSNFTDAQVTDTTRPPLSIDPDLLALPQNKTPKEYIIGGIKVVGTKYLDESLLISISGLNVGDKITIPGSDNFARAINNLWKQNLFANVQIFYTKLEGNTIYLEIDVTERPRLSSFNFKNIGKAESDDLDQKVGLIKGRVVTENMKRSAIEAIKKYYADKGYQNAQVRIGEARAPGTQNSEILSFLVNKGQKVKISQINFYGNQVASEAKLKKQLKDTKELSRITLFPPDNKGYFGEIKRETLKEYIDSYGFLSFTATKEFLDPYFRFKLFSSAKFNEQKYNADLEKIIAYYNSLGYRDAAIADTHRVVNKLGKMDIDIKVSEGQKYYFGNITWKGNTKYSDSTLTALLGIKKGDVYDLDVLNRRLGKQISAESNGNDIYSLYTDDGYLFFAVDPVETAVYNDTIDFEIRLREGGQATIKNVTITGNEKTKEYVIRRELRTIPGDKFSRDLLVRSVREIGALGFFNQEKINPNPVPNQEDGTVDINWNVEEKSSDQLELSAGWGGGIGLTGTLGVSFNNFSVKHIFSKEAWDPLPTGDGQKLSLRVQSNGKAYQSYNASFTEPWLGGKKRNSFTVSLYRSIFRTGGYNYRTNTYAFSDSNSLKNVGITVALGKQLKWPDDYFTLTYSLNYVQYDLHNYSLFTPLFRNGHSNNLSFKIALSRYSVNNPLFPTGGSNFLLSVQFTPPYTSFNPNITATQNYQLPEYHKWRFTDEWYIPIGRPLGAEHNRVFVLKASVKYGFMGRYTSKLDYSPFERFQLGDAGLTNNFGLLGYDIISQRGYPVYQNSDPKVNPENQTSSQFFTIFNKYTLELRYPLSTSAASTIYGETFFEAANGWYDYTDYNPFRLRRSVGAGLRFFLPMFGLLGFDYGIGLDRIQNGSLKNASRFTFMLGYEPE